VAPSNAVAEAVIVTVPDCSREPDAGDVMETAGGVWGEATVMFAAADVVTPPLLSVALAVSVYVPAPTLVQLKL
jgi:hypothetical protein